MDTNKTEAAFVRPDPWCVEEKRFAFSVQIM